MQIILSNNLHESHQPHRRSKGNQKLFTKFQVPIIHVIVKIRLYFLQNSALLHNGDKRNSGMVSYTTEMAQQGQLCQRAHIQPSNSDQDLEVQVTLQRYRDENNKQITSIKVTFPEAYFLIDLCIFVSRVLAENLISTDGNGSFFYGCSTYTRPGGYSRYTEDVCCVRDENN